jgi:hypothetical protein
MHLIGIKIAHWAELIFDDKLASVQVIFSRPETLGSKKNSFGLRS